MRTSELRDLTKDEVLVRKEELEKEIFNLKIRQATKQIENPLKIRTIKDRKSTRLNSSH